MCCTSHTRGRSKYVDGYEASNANNDLVMHAAREHGESTSTSFESNMLYDRLTAKGRKSGCEYSINLMQLL